MIKGLIIDNISNIYKVIVEDNVIECKPMGKLKQQELSPVVGDYVEIEMLENEYKKGMITKILPRLMYSKRPKIANLTQIIFVLSLKFPKPDLLLLDKQLAYAEFLKIKPIICINKIDLGQKNLKDDIKRIYKNIGYTVIETNAKEKVGIKNLKKLLNGNITAFSGNSGVGKSSLINSIFEEEKAQEGIVSKKIKRGKNTTTNTTLYAINNGYIADTPGFSTFEINEIESKELGYYFKEFKEYINKCEYGDCKHLKEENCAIKKAIKEGKISKSRYDSYQRIIENLEGREEHKW